jgi:hypothetical protein
MLPFKTTYFVLAICSAVWLPCQAAQAATLWEQSDFRLASSAGATSFLPVNDFVLPAPASVASFTVWLSDASPILGGDGNADGTFFTFSGVLSWYIFLNAGGLPGALVDSGTDLAPSVVDTGIDRTDNSEDIFRVSGVLDTPVALAAGTYWFGIREGPPGQVADETSIVWLSHDLSGAPTKLFLDGATPGDLNEAPTIDNAMVLRDVPEPASLVLLLLGLVGFLIKSPRVAVASPASRQGLARGSGVRFKVVNQVPGDLEQFSSDRSDDGVCGARDFPGDVGAIDVRIW